jgi:hypothetical protein
MLEGGCFCGRVRYEVDEGEYIAADCHCTLCRRIHAAPHVTWLVVPMQHFRYTSAPPNPLRSTESGTRYFCGACGTHVACVNAAHAEIVDVSICSLDAPEAFVPTLEVFTDTRLPAPRRGG